MAVTCPVQLAADLDLSSWHLPDLVDLSALTADDRADQLRNNRGETETWMTYVGILKRRADMLYKEKGSINRLTECSFFFSLLAVLLMKVILTKGQKQNTRRKKKCVVLLSWLNADHFKYSITLFSVDWSSIMHVKSFPAPPRVSLNCYCVCTGKRDDGRHICLSLIWVAKRLLIPRSGDDFPNKSLPKHTPARRISALMENIMGK